MWAHNWANTCASERGSSVGRGKKNRGDDEQSQGPGSQGLLEARKSQGEKAEPRYGVEFFLLFVRLLFVSVPSSTSIA